MPRTVIFFLVCAAALFGCASLQQLSDTAKEINQTTREVNQTADEVEQTGQNVSNTADRADNAANKIGGVELEDNGGNNGGSSETWCCVNGAFYDCGTAAAANQCIGDPMTMMQCMDGCGMDSSCEDSCMSKHGPDPSSCRRDGSRDATCTQ